MEVQQSALTTLSHKVAVTPAAPSTRLSRHWLHKLSLSITEALTTHFFRDTTLCRLEQQINIFCSGQLVPFSVVSKQAVKASWISTLTTP